MVLLLPDLFMKGKIFLHFSCVVVANMMLARKLHQEPHFICLHKCFLQSRGNLNKFCYISPRSCRSNQIKLSKLLIIMYARGLDKAELFSSCPLSFTNFFLSCQYTMKRVWESRNRKENVNISEVYRYFNSLTLMK